jgi:hypothetical protein
MKMMRVTIPKMEKTLLKLMAMVDVEAGIGSTL